ncbi:tetratricopeptide repeat protein [Parvibaculum lavamentivorans]|uniref:tetratricopeptide repeat protein n=1 Tax=Parvibaculum lavamentivorans TaxID=256618 RepID=UPI001446C53D|nr:tetratricopeptide repeat protein [Parvibaculum lavamentivorans]
MRLTRGVCFAALLGMGLSGCAGTGGFSGGLFSKEAESPYGAYLAGRHAASVNDNREAATFYDRALRDEPNDPIILERAFMASVTAGDMERAVPLARRLVAIEPGQRMARLTLSLADVKNGKYASAREEIALAEPGPFTALVGVLASAWAAAGEGDKALALEQLSAFEGRAAFALFRAYHEALMLEILGDAEGAGEAYKAAMETSGGGSIRVVQAYASYLSRQGRTDDARAVLEGFIGLSPDHPLAEYELKKLNAEGTLPPLVKNAPEGVAEALYGLGSALATDTSSNLAELYLNLAIYMRPDFDIARSLLAGSYEAQSRWADAIAAYDEVGKGTPLYMNARIQSALALDRLDKEAEAIAVLERLAKDDPEAIEPHVAMGDILRAKEKYAEAAVHYDRAIAMSGEPDERDWTLYYARGICAERLGQWDRAEADLTLALELSDDHPLVLNYLGYSWIEQHHRLDEALAMIEKAVERRPNDGFIVDSLGWARYRLGEYATAVKYLERAAELQPGDPTINEHLGDALWKVGRKIEARFQWRHALALEPEKKREDILRTKLDFGLEAGENAEKAENEKTAPAPAGS